MKGSNDGFLLAHPGTPSFAQQAALALEEGSMLGRFVTTVVDRPDAAWRALACRLPAVGDRIDKELKRRAVNDALLPKTATFSRYELARVLASRMRSSGKLAHRIWERGEAAFDQWAASQLNGFAGAYGYENASLHLLRAARSQGLFAVLDLPALAQGDSAKVYQRELERWPELTTPYLRGLAQLRTEQSSTVGEQIRLAHCVITNSQLTLDSYRACGHSMDHALVVSYAGPDPIAQDALPEQRSGPLRLLFAGNLNLGKGGHYLLEALAREPQLRDVTLTVCGRVALPNAFLRDRLDRVALRGHLPSADLRRAYLEHDVLVLPTLSDGFGLVVTEALAHGLPVITTDRCGAADRIQAGINGWIVAAADLDALRDALVHCARNRDSLYAMRTAALASAGAYGWGDYRRRLRQALVTRLERPEEPA